MRTAVRILGIVIAALALVLAASCKGDRQSSGSRQPAVVFVLFDISGSTSAPAIRQRYLDDFGHILDAVQGGDVVMGDVITQNTMATATYPIRMTFPKYSAFRYSRLTYDRAFGKAKDEVMAQARTLVLKSAPAPQTDLMNAFQLADKLFNGEQWRSSHRKVLVIFSDMIEQSPRHNFASADLSGGGVQRIIDEEHRAGNLPDLNAVQVWVAGATASSTGGLPPERIHQIQQFWLRYFQGRGAQIDGSRYAPRLINFALHE